MLFFGRKMFSCVWLHFKKCFEKYFLMFGCVLENTIENTFSTCCSHFLTFSRLPNKYIISFIPQNTNKTQKKIIKSGHLAWSQSARRRDRNRHIALSRSKLRAIAIAIDAMPVMSVDDIGELGFGWSLLSLLSFFLSLSLSLSLFYFPRPEIIWSENGKGNDFPLFWLSFSVNWKCFSVWPNLK